LDSLDSFNDWRRRGGDWFLGLRSYDNSFFFDASGLGGLCDY
jgi:hypothetical protein